MKKVTEAVTELESAALNKSKQSARSSKNLEERVRTPNRNNNGLAMRFST